MAFDLHRNQCVLVGLADDGRKHRPNLILHHFKTLTVILWGRGGRRASGSLLSSSSLEGRGVATKELERKDAAGAVAEESS